MIGAEGKEKEEEGDDVDGKEVKREGERRSSILKFLHHEVVSASRHTVRSTKIPYTIERF